MASRRRWGFSGRSVTHRHRVIRARPDHAKAPVLTSRGTLEAPLPWQGFGGFEGRASLRRIATNRYSTRVARPADDPPSSGTCLGFEPPRADPARQGWLEPFPRRPPRGGDRRAARAAGPPRTNHRQFGYTAMATSSVSTRRVAVGGYPRQPSFTGRLRRTRLRQRHRLPSRTSAGPASSECQLGSISPWIEAGIPSRYEGYLRSTPRRRRTAQPFTRLPLSPPKQG